MRPFRREAIEALGYNVGHPRPKDVQRCGAVVKGCPSMRPGRALPATTKMSTPAFLEGVVTLKQGVLRIACLYLAQRQPARNREISLQTQMDVAAFLNIRSNDFKAEEPLVAGRRLQRHSGRPGRGTIRPPGSNDALFRPRHPRKLSVPARPRAHRRAGAPSATLPVSTRSGIIRLAPGRRNQGLRIDHLLLSPQASDRPRQCRYRQLRGVPGEKTIGSRSRFWADLDFEDGVNLTLGDLLFCGLERFPAKWVPVSRQDKRRQTRK